MSEPVPRRCDNRGMAGEVRIRLLGGFGAELDGVPVAVEAWQRSSATELVKLLALEPGHRLHREQVADRLWPDLDAATAGRRLAKALHYARRVLAARHLVLRGELLSLDARVDVDDFEAAARLGDFDTALALYTGDLLPEHRYDDWAEPRRTQLRDMMLGLLLDQAADRERAGDRRGARESLQRLADADPLHEQAHARLIRLAAADGHRHLALRLSTELADRLRADLGIEPGDDLRALHAELTAGRTGAHAAPAVLQAEERKLVTVLAVDFRGVRPPVQPADPERSRRDAAARADLVGEVVQRWGGVAERQAGGGVLAVFGYPAALEDHAARALWAGFEMLQRIPAATRIGADTGEIVASEGSLCDAGGEVLDVAAWLREAADGRTLLASERARRAAYHGDFRFGRAVTPAGGPVLRARRLLSATWSSDWWRPSRTPLVGRDEELAAVLSLLDEVAVSRRPRLVSLVGAAGVGKTRLVHEVVAAALERRPETRVLRGRCLAAGDGITYWALGEILRDACGIALGERGRTAQQKLHDGVSELLAGSDPSEVDRAVHALAATAAIPVPGNPLDEATPRAVADELAWAWPRFASAAAVQSPVIIVVEDLHWAGAALLEMVVRIAARSTGPVTILTTARPEGFPADLGDLSIISLRSLTDEAGARLLDRLPQTASLTPRRRSEILARAEGNPYFLEQLVAHVAEGGSAALPDSLHALLAARVDALPPAEKRLLQAASVVGRVFWPEPLGRSGDVGDLLAALERRGLVLARPRSALAGQCEYAFKHALLRDVAYASLPIAQRAYGHADTAAWLEELSRERVGEVIELVAYHYAAAADGWEPDAPREEWIRGKALRSLLGAGASVRRRYAPAKALDLHRRALRYAAGVGERAECLEAIGEDFEVAYDGDAALRAWQAAIELLRSEPGHVDLRVRLCVRTAEMAVMRWGGFRAPADPVLGDRVIDEGLSIVADPATRARLLSLRAMCGGRWAWTGRLDPVPAAQRRLAADSGRQIADGLGVPALRSHAMLGQAAADFLDGRYADAVAAVLDEVELVEQGGRDRDRALGHALASLVIGAVHGDHERALHHARTSYALSRDLAPHDRLHGTYFVMAALEPLARWADLEPFLDEHLRLLTGPEAEMSCPYIQSGPLIGALAAARRGELDRARELAAGVRLDLDQPGNTVAWRALVAVELGEPETARTLAAHLVARARRPGPEEIPLDLLAMVEALQAAGDFDALRELLPTARAAGASLAVLLPTCDRAEGVARADPALLKQAADGFVALGLPWHAARTLEHLAAVQPQRAESLRRQAWAAYAQLGAVRDADRIQAARIA